MISDNKSIQGRHLGLPLRILYEDNHCLAVLKAHGELTEGDSTGNRSLFERVKEYLKARDQKPGKVFLGLVQRLDRPVGGVIIFAKTSKGAARLSAQFRAGAIEKIYWAIVEGVPQKRSGESVQFLIKDRDENLARIVEENSKGAKRSALVYCVLADINGRALVEIKPATGRAHQIRVALASLGTPIVGDSKYGARQALSGAIALFARALVFNQVVTGERITVIAEPTLAIFQNFL